MEKLNKLFDGKKTYAIAFLTVVLVLLEKFGGIDIPGFTVGDNWLETIFVALGLGTLRSGVTKSGPTT